MTKVYDDPWAEIEGRCNARKVTGTGLCRNGAGKGTDHPGVGTCIKHLGNTANHRRAAEKIRQAQVLGPLLQRHRDQLGDNPDPYAGVLEVVRNGWAWVRVLEARVDELVDQHHVDGPDGLYAPDHQGDHRPHVLVTMLVDARREHRRNCAEAIRAGIAERIVAIEEDRAVLMAQIIRGVLEELGAWDRPETPDVVRRHLYGISGGQAA